MDTIKSLSDLYISYLRINKNASQLTIKSYSIVLEKFTTFFYNITDINLISKLEIENYIITLSARGLSPRSLNHTISILSSFFKFLVRKKVIKINIFEFILRPKYPKQLPRYLSNSQLEVIINYQSSSKYIKIKERNSLIIEILSSTGLRISELVSIKINDLSFNDNSLKIKGKGAKERFVFLSKVTANKLKNYIKKYTDQQSIYLFENKQRKHLSTRIVEYIFEEIRANNKDFYFLHPHLLRHTFATSLLNSGINLRTIQAILGHSSIVSTQIYTSVSMKNIKDSYLNKKI